MAENFTVPAFLQECDVDTIHQKMMDMLPDDIDKTEAGLGFHQTDSIDCIRIVGILHPGDVETDVSAME